MVRSPCAAAGVGRGAKVTGSMTVEPLTASVGAEVHGDVLHSGLHRGADFLERIEHAAALGAGPISTIHYNSGLPSTSRSLTLNCSVR